MKTQLLSRLYQQLKQFGLNSHEWVILPINAYKCEIQHADDPNFRLIGRIRKQRWSQIWLASL